MWLFFLSRRIKHNRTILTWAESTSILRIKEEKLMCCPEIQQGRHFCFPLCNFLSLCSHRCLHIFMMNLYNCVYDVFEKKTSSNVKLAVNVSSIATLCGQRVTEGQPILQTCFLLRDSLRLDRILKEEVQTCTLSCFMAWCIWDCVCITEGIGCRRNPKDGICHSQSPEIYVCCKVSQRLPNHWYKIAPFTLLWKMLAKTA